LIHPSSKAHLVFNLIYSQQANQLEPELGTAQPQLVFVFFIKSLTKNKLKKLGLNEK
jgi:hypothetical protein